MAYKFQVGPAVLSGSTKFEEELELAGGLKFSGSIDTAIAVGSDSILFRDSDGTVKTDTVTDLATAMAGDGLAASSGVLAVGVDDSSIELNSDALRIKAAGVTDAMLNDDVATGLAGDGLAASSGVLAVGVDDSSIEINSDALRIKAAGVTDAMLNDDVAAGLAGVGLSAASGVMALDLNELTAEAVASGDFLAFVDSTDNGTHKESVDDLATLFAGAGLAASSAVLSVQVSGAVVVASDKVGISGSIAGDGLAFAGGADSIAALSLSIPGMAQSMTGDVADADEFAISDGGTMKKVDFSVVRDAVFADVSGDATVAAGGALTIANNAVEPAMINASVAGDGLSGGGGSALALDLNELTAAAVAVAADSIAIIDADDNSSKKESIADLMTAVAGNGLAAASGVLSLDASEVSAAAIASGDHFVFHDVTDDSTKKETVDDLATFMAGPGLGASSGELSIDLNELGAATVDVANDSLAIIDATDNTTKKEAIADIVGGIAGDGLVAASGQLSTRMTVTSGGDEDYNAAFGLNINSANYTAPRTVTLPTANSADAGRMLIIKARNAGTHTLSIARNGSDVIDGTLTGLSIESDNGAVTLLCAAAGSWIIV